MKTSVNPYFSAEWYVDRYPDVKDYPDGPEAHYDMFGWQELRSPHPLFDVEWYLTQAPELKKMEMEPTEHYRSRGWREMLSPHPLFDTAWYLTKYPDILRADIDPIWHYLQKGWKEGRSLHPLFDTEWYLKANPKVREENLDPLSHYLQIGWHEDRSPHPLFANDWYRETYALTRESDPWQHYIRHGWREGKSPHPLFDAPWYEASYLDPATHRCEPLTHYLTWGWKEGLLPRPNATETLQNGDRVAPLYRAALDPKHPVLSKLRQRKELRQDSRRGKLLLVTHDMQLGGAQQVLKMFADWIQTSTRFSVGIVAVKGGHFKHAFEALAPVFVLAEHAEEDRADALKAWAGEDVKAVFVNSIASGSFYKYWRDRTPGVAFIHELQKILEIYPDEVALIRERADHVISGGPDVARILRDVFDFDPDHLTSGYSFIEALPDDYDETARRLKRAQVRREFDISDESILVMGCGVVHWRKSPDKFIETAERVLAAGIDAHFVWLGSGPDEDACIALAKMKGLGDRVRFTGYEPDVAGKLAGADIFLLSSQEDPFPLVALYAAQAGAPVVCFEKAGGIADFVKTGSGIAVPFNDVDAMADAVKHYALDSDLRSQASKIGQHQVATTHTVEAAGPILLHHLRNVAGLAPEVSVVLPNYNYAAYLPERLSSIARQSFQDFEVILLDDASNDASPQILENFAKTRLGTRLALNRENSGSPFVQWMRGMEMANADIIWLAEADDYCENSLLQTLLPFFDDRNVRLASCASIPVQSDGTIIGDYRPLYLDRIQPGRWNSDFVVTDHEEANAGLGIANTIPNASAVMFRKFTPDAEFADQVTRMRLCGDWFFYVRTMKGGHVGFSAAALNYHRRHGETVTHRLEGSLQYFEELAEVRTYIGRTYRQNDAARARVAEFLEQDVTRFKVADPSKLAQAPKPGKALPSLAVIAPDLSPGGGQMFAISLANEWVNRGGRAVLLNVRSQPTHPAVVSKLHPAVSLFHAGEAEANLDEIVERFDIDIIHSSIWWADIMVDAYHERLPEGIPWVITMHGCHETILQHPNVDPQFAKRLARMTKRASAWVYTAEKNLQVFDSIERPARLLRIPNGMAEEPAGTTLTREGLGLRADALVLCLASRAIPSKGWSEAVALTQTLNGEGHKVDLVLIGEGPSADDLRTETPEHVHLMGQVSNLQEYFTISDVGILPSYFVGESLPLVLIEMMAKSLPLVASAVGEIPGLVGSGEDAGGLLIPLVGDRLDMPAFEDAVRRMLDPGLRQRMGANSRKRFDADYRLDRMVDRYAILYDEVGART